MFLLPKGNPLAELPVAKLQLPEALEKLKVGKLTGCASFDFPSADCGLVYDEGRLIAAVVNREGKEHKGQEALQVLVDLLHLASAGNFRVFGFSREIVQALAGMLAGTAILESADIKQVDFKALLDKIKVEQMTGTLKLFTSDRAGLIFYKAGTTVGFFHDASTAIETTAGPVQQIAALPGARVDLMVLQSTEAAMQDLSSAVDISRLWQAASGNIFAPAQTSAPLKSATDSNSTPSAQPVSQTVQASVNHVDIESAILDLANRYVGKLGRTLAEKELMNFGGVKAIKDPKALTDFLAALEKGSKLLASANKIKEMKDAISLEASKL